ncbi:isochorismatase family protein [Bradyrhizobium stylosanthis]|uniref:isochorismatase family protein n=1 Tax=Bradyrhizobium stylosanthis TaxID=1803665 RepID=UPI0007C4F6FA|nr:isochorismatase family protein [Bradyrhizobium stylosanthis]
MLADPRQSRIVLLNPARANRAGTAEALAVEQDASLALLPICQDILGARSIAVGEYPTGLLPADVAGSIECFESDALSPWRDPGLAANLEEAGVGIIFLGGGFLEEEVLVAALEGAKRGYDVRLLSDLAFARRETDRQLVLNRLAHHGIIATTVRQALVEWAAVLEDRAMMLRIQQLIS